MGRFWCDSCGNVRCTCQQDAKQRTSAVAEFTPVNNTRTLVLTEEALAGESSEYLEKTRAQLRALFSIEQLHATFKVICICAAIAAAYAVLGILGGRLLGLWFVLLISALLVIQQLFRLVIGPPRASTKPEETLRQYLHHCVLSGNVHSVGMDGYVLLLHSAQRQFQDSVRMFEEYWLDANYAIRHELTGRLEYSGDDLLISRTVGPGVVQYRGDNIAHCLAQVSFAAKLKHYSPVAFTRRRHYQIGEVRYQLEYDLGKVGELWYVANPKWESAIVKVIVSKESKWT